MSLAIAWFWCALTLVTVASPAPAATSPALDNLIARLPDPRTWTKSPLQTALKDQDPIVQDPAMRQVAVALSKHDLRAALGAIRPLTERYPQRPGIHLLHGMLAFEMGNFVEAESAFRLVVTLKPDSAHGWQFLALSQTAQQHYAAGMISARKAVQLAPKEAIGWAGLCVTQFGLNHPEEALASAQQATRVAPDSSGNWMLLGASYAHQKRFSEAIKSYEHALRLTPGNEYVLICLGICQMENHQPGAAIAPFRQVVDHEPRAYRVMVMLADCYLRTGDPAQGGILCRRALTVKSDYAPAWRLLGTCSQQQGNERDAAADFQKAAKYTPSDSAAQASLIEATRNR